MNKQLLNEVIECLNNGRRLVHYYDDKYAFYLLEKYCEKNGETSISEIKLSNFSRLLQRPKVKHFISSLGDGIVSSKRFQQMFYEDYQSYVITLSSWGDETTSEWDQTSVPGANLVVQINLTNQHDQWLKDLKITSEYFRFDFHPIHAIKSSMSWARIDLDFNTGEALIEEIQNDWLREAAWHARLAKKAVLRGEEYYLYFGEKISAKSMLQYNKLLDESYRKRWQEITLFYAIKLIKQEIGISTIFYHSFLTGALLKRIEGGLPPKSLYTQLPKRFCFSQCTRGPDFITRHKKVRRRVKKAKQVQWFQLCL